MALNDPALIDRTCAFHARDAMAARALDGVLRRGPFERSAETGCGGSTIVLSHASRHHTAFAIEGTDQTITELHRHSDLQQHNVVFVGGETKNTLPGHVLEGPLDFVLLDGPHAYPLPQVEYAYLFPAIRVEGWIAIDDIQIPSVHELFRFLKQEPSVVLEEVIVRTAFFRRSKETAPGPDGWTEQGINRRPVLRYAWRDRLRKWIKP